MTRARIVFIHASILATAVMACSGSRSSIIAQASASADSGNGQSDAQTDTDTGDASDTDSMESTLKLYFDSSPGDRGIDVDDAAFEAAEASLTCTPIPPVSYGCGSSLSFTSPEQYCVVNLTGGRHNFVASVPSACQCAETFGCACLLAYGNPCVGFGSYDGSFSGCSNMTGLLVDCP